MKWTKNELYKLMRLEGKYDSVSKIAEYFPERTYGSVYSKVREIKFLMRNECKHKGCDNEIAPSSKSRCREHLIKERTSSYESTVKSREKGICVVRGCDSHTEGTWRCDYHRKMRSKRREERRRALREEMFTWKDSE